MLQNSDPPRELQGWSTGANTAPPSECAHQFFERQVGHSGDSVAVICGDKRLTYGELNGRANQLARHLRELGVGPDMLVAICVTRGVDLAVGILGILKAGGAWVPMDPRHPRERKQTVLESTKAPFLLTESSLVSDLPTSGIQTVVLDTAWAEISSRNPSNLDNVAVASNLAYVMFTSGSTGRPKGVMVTHANLAQYVVCNARSPDGDSNRHLSSYGEHCLLLFGQATLFASRVWSDVVGCHGRTTARIAFTI